MRLGLTSTALITIADTLVPVAATEDGKAYLSPKAICDSLGISWPGQYTKIMADPVLASSVAEIEMEVPRSDTGSLTTRKTLMLPKEMVPGWLFTIKKVHPAIQAKLNRFRHHHRSHPHRPRQGRQGVHQQLRRGGLLREAPRPCDPGHQHPLDGSLQIWRHPLQLVRSGPLRRLER